MPVKPHQPRRLRLRLRRLFLAPTGKRRKVRTKDDAQPTTPTPKPSAPTSAEVIDAVMRRLADRTAHQVQRATDGASLIGELVGVVVAYPPRPSYPPRPAAVPRPRTPVNTVVKITTLDTPPVGVALLDPTSVPPIPTITPDEFLMTVGWDRLFQQALDERFDDVVNFTLRQRGAVVRVSETTVEIPKISAEPVLEAHLCKNCHEFNSGDSFGGRMWRCSGCLSIAAY
jgi:hypothetical protein